MATYDIDNLPAKFAVGDIINCPYKGAERSITLPKGNYKLECWGARGEIDSSASQESISAWNATPEGYSYGDLSLTTPTQLFLVSGGKGQSSSGGGGYNGGGNKKDSSGSTTTGFAGGGATHIALRSGLLYSLKNYKSDVVIVAGGAGGIGSLTLTISSSQTVFTAVNGGNGGGISGGDGSGKFFDSRTNKTTSEDGYYGYGGTQTTGGAHSQKSSLPKSGEFGKGGDNRRGKVGAPGAGGGGWYGGGGGYSWDESVSYFHYYHTASGGGGSGYVADASHAVGTVYLTNAKTLQGTESGYKANPDSSEHNGYIRITILEISSGAKFFATYNKQVIIPETQAETDTVPITYNNSTIATLTGSNGFVFTCKNKKSRSNFVIGEKTILSNGKIFKDDIFIGNIKNILPAPSQFSLSGVALSNNVFTYNSGVVAMASVALPTPVVGHKYYGYVEQKVASGVEIPDGRFEYYYTDVAGTGLMTFTAFNSAIKDNQWHSYSNILSLTGLASDTGWQLRSFAVSATRSVQRRNHIIVDLTEIFGAGHEPSIEWCDANIPLLLIA